MPYPQPAQQCTAHVALPHIGNTFKQHLFVYVARALTLRSTRPAATSYDAPPRYFTENKLARLSIQPRPSKTLSCLHCWGQWDTSSRPASAVARTKPPRGSRDPRSAHCGLLVCPTNCCASSTSARHLTLRRVQCLGHMALATVDLDGRELARRRNPLRWKKTNDL